MYLRIVDDLQRKLQTESEVLERESITIWLMRFSAGLPLNLEHPVMGKISYGGIRFAGSVVPTYDRYVGLMTEDLIERNLIAFESALASVEPGQLQEVVLRAMSLFAQTRTRLWARAAETKGRLLARPGQPSDPIAISLVGVNQVVVAARLNSRVNELRRNMPPKEKLPVWGWLEAFQKRNPALSNVISFVAGVVATS